MQIKLSEECLGNTPELQVPYDLLPLYIGCLCIFYITRDLDGIHIRNGLHSKQCF